MFLPLGGAGSWDRFNQSLANNDPIQVGDELRIYYGGRMYRHGPYNGPDKGVERGGIGLATIKRDRFVALDGSFEKGASITTKPLKLSGTTLHMNAKADFGEIVVELLNEQGNSIAKSKPLAQDGIDLPVQWKGDLKLPENAALKISISNARLYSVWTD